MEHIILLSLLEGKGQRKDGETQLALKGCLQTLLSYPWSKSLLLHYFSVFTLLDISYRNFPLKKSIRRIKTEQSQSYENHLKHQFQVVCCCCCFVFLCVRVGGLLLTFHLNAVYTNCKERRKNSHNVSSSTVLYNTITHNICLFIHPSFLYMLFLKIRVRKTLSVTLSFLAFCLNW